MNTKIKQIVVAGGCFWGLEDLIREVPGVLETESGYCGGSNENPTYEQHPDHAEAVQITYNSDVIDYQHILDFFFQIHNPTTLNQQGNDKGTSYRSAIFYANDEERQIAEEMIDVVNESERWGDPVVTTLEPLDRFWPAEEYHQDYLVKNPGGYTCHAIYFDSYLK
jgi:peptide-methionine (S)-S-oxide reductase